jgi:hypothetical protein
MSGVLPLTDERTGIDLVNLKRNMRWYTKSTSPRARPKLVAGTPKIGAAVFPPQWPFSLAHNLNL